MKLGVKLFNILSIREIVKISFIIFYFSNISIFNAQKNNLIIEYQLSMDKNIGGSVFYDFLISEQDITYYFGYRPLDSRNKVEDIIKEFDISRTNNLRIKYDYKSDILYEFKATVEPKKILIYEEIPNIIWMNKPEKKKILGYNCNSATAKFRGRNYEVWFTTEIQANEGPWKLKGLPGVILFAKDDTDKFEYEAKRIIINSNIETPLALVEYFNNNRANVVKLSEAIPMENNFLNKMRSKIRSSYPLGTKFLDTPIRGEMKESHFEWEATVKP